MLSGMKNPGDHATDNELRGFVDRFGPEILEVIREKRLAGVDEERVLQSALTELSYRWGVLPPPGTTLSDLLAESSDPESDPFDPSDPENELV